MVCNKRSLDCLWIMLHVCWPWWKNTCSSWFILSPNEEHFLPLLNNFILDIMENWWCGCRDNEKYYDAVRDCREKFAYCIVLQSFLVCCYYTFITSFITPFCGSGYCDWLKLLKIFRSVQELYRSESTFFFMSDSNSSWACLLYTSRCV